MSLERGSRSDCEKIISTTIQNCYSIYYSMGHMGQPEFGPRKIKFLVGDFELVLEHNSIFYA
jgi:hypothetical protein